MLWLRKFLVTKTSDGFFRKDFVEIVDQDMADINRDMMRLLVPIRSMKSHEAEIATSISICRRGCGKVIDLA